MAREEPRLDRSGQRAEARRLPREEPIADAAMRRLQETFQRPTQRDRLQREVPTTAKDRAAAHDPEGPGDPGPLRV
jgi:hypothetical protein